MVTLFPALNHAIPEASAWSGIGWLSLLFLAVLTFDFLAQYIQIRIMQRVASKTMYDMRGEIFSHMQRFADELLRPQSHGPAGHARYYGRRCPQRSLRGRRRYHDQRLFLLAVMAGLLFKIEPPPCSRHARGSARHPDRHHDFPQIRPRRESPHPHGHRPHQRFSQEYISGMSVVQLFNRERKAVEEFEKRNRDNMLAWRDAILAYALSIRRSNFSASPPLP